MAYDKQYYDNKKTEIQTRIQQSKDKIISKMIQDMNEFLAEQQNLDKDYKELLEIEKESQDRTEKVNKEEIDKKIKEAK